MIVIEEKKSKKCPLQTSLYLSFDYRQEFVDIVRSCDSPVYDKKTKVWEVPCSELSRLLDGFGKYDSITLNLLKDEKSIDSNKKSLNFNSCKTNPFSYQKDGIEYGINHDKFLLLDAPGLGKSLQILYIAQERKKSDKLKHCLIICGINTLKTNWKKEVATHTNLDCKILGERVTKTGKINYGGVKERLEDLKSNIKEFFVITNVETLRNPDIIKELTKGKNEFDMIVFDEIHACKNPQSQQGKNLLKLKAKYMIGATGTVLTNSPLDAYVPLKWIGAENCSYSNFKYYFCKYGGSFGNELLGYKHVDLLKDELSKFSLRRTKDLLDLPPKTVINEIVDMTPTQTVFYNNIKQGIVNQVDKVHMSTSNLLSMISRLRQATACPSILTTENIESAKIDRCVDLVEQIVSNNEKVIVYSTFKETLNIVNEKIKQYKPLLCTGDIKDSIISEI